MMASTAWKVVQAHIPMIKFRNGGIDRAVAGVVGSQSAGSGAAATPQKTGGSLGPKVISLPVIDDFQLPPRYQRRPIDSKEIDYINRGGPE